MRNDKQELVDRIFIVLKVIIVGIFSGFIGMVVFAALTPPTDLSGDIIKAMFAGFFTMIVAVIVVIYRYNRQRKK